MNLKFIQLVFVVLVMLPKLINSQTNNIEVRGIILDESNYPVPYVAVGIVKKHIGTSSTEDGDFSFLITKNELQDSLSISSLGYMPYKIKVDDYLKLEDKTVILTETITELNEIKLLNPKDYVINALKNLEDNTLSDPYKLELLYRRATTEGNKAKFFVEHYIKIRDKGPSKSPGIIQIVEAKNLPIIEFIKTNNGSTP